MLTNNSDLVGLDTDYMMQFIRSLHKTFSFPPVSLPNTEVIAGNCVVIKK